VRVGDEAVLWGAHLPVAQIAEQAATLVYQLLTGVSKRVTRIPLQHASTAGTARQP
jgi:alanine racemase